MYRKARVAGQFYPGSRSELLQELKDRFSMARAEHLPGAEALNDTGKAVSTADAEHIGEESRLVGIIAPHAGYMFSGMQAAKAYRHLQGRRFRRVCVLSPSHYDYFEGISIYGGEGYETPLGRVDMDTEARTLLLEHGLAVSGEAGHRREHALEVQIPFLQYVLGETFLLTPLVMGAQGPSEIRRMEEAVSLLMKFFGPEILFVGSTDLSHFHSESQAADLDGRVIRHIAAMDADALERDLAQGAAEACGGGPVTALLRVFSRLEGVQCLPLGYSHSGMVIPDRSSVVGYTSALIIQKPNAAGEEIQ